MQRAHRVLVFTFFRNAANFPKGLEIKTHTTAYSCICILRALLAVRLGLTCALVYSAFEPTRHTRSHMSNNLNPQIIAAAIEGFEGQKKRLDAQIRELRTMLNGGRSESAATEPPKRKRRRTSAAWPKRIAEAQQMRPAATKQQSAPSLQVVIPEAPKRKWRLSAAGRTRIIDATKRRWALKRAELEKAQRASAKKGAPGKVAAKRAAA